MSGSQDIAVLADYLATVDAAALPADVQETAKACLLYGLAVGIATRRARPARLALQAASRNAEPGTATRLLDGARASHGSAVFANAVLLSGRVQGDSHPCGHIGGVVIPAALAAAETERASGRELLSALVTGYESALRIGRDHAADLSVRGFRTTPCYGVFGAAVATARARKASATQIAHALGLAANYAGGLREYVDAGTEESPFQAGFAARNGVYVADLVACGLESAPSALHGNAGFYRAYAGSDADYGRRMLEALGRHFEFTTVTYKQYPACQFLRGIIRGLAALRTRAGNARPRDIELRMNPYEADFIGVRHAGPYTSATQTVMSAPFCAALAWTTGTASFDGLRVYDDPRVLELVQRTHVISDAGRARYEPLLRVALDDGNVLTWEEHAGGSEYRVTWKAAVEMTQPLCVEVGAPEEKATAVIDAVAGIADAPDAGRLIAAVRAATTSDRRAS